MRRGKLVRGVLAAGLVAALACGSQSDEGTQDTSAEEYVGRVAAEHAEDAPVASDAAKTEPATAVSGAKASYATIDAAPVTGYLARPEASASPEAGIIVIHEWWGLNDNVRAMAERLAGEGYVALAVDLYQGESAETRERARELWSAAMKRGPALQSNLRQAIAYLEERVGVSRIGTIGWCMGGGWSLDTALQNPEQVDATVIYYGRLVTDPERLQVLQTPILGLFGAEDSSIPVETVREFESALLALNKPATVFIYEGANHAFANPSGTAYQEEAAEDAWQHTLRFFREHLS